MTDQSVSTQFSEQTLVIVGVGLIGGSIAAAAKQKSLAGRVIGVGRDHNRLEIAISAGLIDSATQDLTEAAKEADFIVFCTPVNLIVDGVRTAAPHCRPGTLITDAGSVKGTICREVADLEFPANVSFIGSHPLAGSEKRGFEHSDASLFEGRVCVVTPDQNSSTTELKRLSRFWELLGMTVLEMQKQEHDRALAQTSHLPHVVAAVLASELSEANRNVAATGFADTTRIAAGDPELWAAILLSNADMVLAGLESYSANLEKFREAIANRDADCLKDLLKLAKGNRDALGS